MLNSFSDYVLLNPIIIWRPHVIQDFTKIQLKLLPLMYIFELVDIMFFIKSLKAPTSNFNITDYVTFSRCTTRSSFGLKLIHNFTSNNKMRSFYFNRLPQLWNSLPIIDLHLPINTIKGQLKQYYLWRHFMNNFNPADPCSLCYLCPCRDHPVCSWCSVNDSPL